MSVLPVKRRSSFRFSSASCQPASSSWILRSLPFAEHSHPSSQIRSGNVIHWKTAVRFPTTQMISAMMSVIYQRMTGHSEREGDEKTVPQDCGTVFLLNEISIVFFIVLYSLFVCSFIFLQCFSKLRNDDFNVADDSNV